RLARFRFEINGHTDVAGRLGYNLALSELRAASVVDYLAGRGVERARLKPQGFGPLQLLDPANPRSEVNRRVEVFAVPPAPAS
ncbi:MAG: OmpA family protein, partial [Acetobacteraceae bacterium]|nr:OmpA family protein [Acetobacteraceae bacterium]